MKIKKNLLCFKFCCYLLVARCFLMQQKKKILTALVLIFGIISNLFLCLHWLSLKTSKPSLIVGQKEILREILLPNSSQNVTLEVLFQQRRQHLEEQCRLKGYRSSENQIIHQPLVEDDELGQLYLRQDLGFFMCMYEFLSKN